jgi:peptide/nickel transport system permease protein
MLLFILRRLLLAVPMVIGSSLLVFSVFYISRIDPVKRMLGERSQNVEAVAEMRRSLGLDRPAHVRYLGFLAGIARGDFGRSMATREPVMDEIRQRFPATLELTLAAMAISVSFGLAAGCIAAIRRNTPADYAAMGVSLLGVSVPVFWLGLLLSYCFSEKLGWLPQDQRLTIWLDGQVEPRTGLLLVDSALARNWEVFKDALLHLILPATALAAVTSALVARMTRASMLEALRQDYVRTARAKGLPPSGVLKHVLRNALIPVVTIVGLEIPALLGGAVITETIFSWPGMGTYLVQSILSGDITAAQGTIMFLTLVFIAANLLVDVLYAVIDPRLRRGLGEG